MCDSCCCYLVTNTESGREIQKKHNIIQQPWQRSFVMVIRALYRNYLWLPAVYTIRCMCECVYEYVHFNVHNTHMGFMMYLLFLHLHTTHITFVNIFFQYLIHHKEFFFIAAYLYKILHYGNFVYTAEQQKQVNQSKSNKRLCGRRIKTSLRNSNN